MNIQEEQKFSGSEEPTARETTQSESSRDQTTHEQSTGPGDAQSQALIDELNVLGAKFAEAIAMAWKSEQRKRLEEDLRTGVVGVAQSLEQHLKEFSRREETRKVLDKAEDVADKVRSSKVSQEIATALTQGLRALSEQLDKLSQEMRERDAAAKTAKSEEATSQDPAGAENAGQDIPIERG